MDTGVMQVGNGDESPLPCHDSKCPMESRVASLEQLLASQSALISSLSSQLATQNIENVALKSKVETLTEEVESLKQQQDKEQSVKGVKLLFNFDKIRKKDVLVWIIEMIEKKGFESTIEKLIEFLAIFTNLGSKDTIRTQLYDYKRHF
jgi:uncharacterized coiled-coil protein SlyX